MWSSKVQNLYQTHPEWVVAAIGGIVLLIVLLAFWIRYLRKTAHQRMVRKTVKGMTQSFLRDVIIPDGLDGFVAIDYLLLTPGGVLVLDIQNYSGVLFGGDRIDHWTQMVEGKSYKFENPVRQNHTRVQAVKALTPEVSVTGRVVFASSGNFPKGIPDGVSMLDTVKKDVSHLLAADEIPAALTQAWETIRANAQEPYKA